MAAIPGVRARRSTGSPGSPGLVGYRYLLAVALLVVLSSGPMLAAVLAGTAALDEADPSDPADRPPVVTHRLDSDLRDLLDLRDHSDVDPGPGCCPRGARP